jgi:hypothetical protein
MTTTHMFSVTICTPHAIVKHVSNTKSMHWYIICKCKKIMSSTDSVSREYWQTSVKSEYGILTTIKI